MKPLKSTQERSTTGTVWAPLSERTEVLAPARNAKCGLWQRFVDAGPLRSFANFMRSRKSAIPLSVAVVFGAANLISYLRMPEWSTMDDGFVYFGWPFDMYFRGGYAGQEVLSITGVIGNVFVALCVIRLARKFFTKS